MRSISSRGPIETLSILFGLGKVYRLSKTHTFYRVFFLRKFFITCISRYIPYLYTNKVRRFVKDTFDIPSDPSVQPVPSNSALRASRVNLPWTPKGHCRCLLTMLNAPPWLRANLEKSFLWFLKLPYYGDFASDAVNPPPMVKREAISTMGGI